MSSPKLLVDNSFSRLVGFSPELMAQVKQALTYKDIENEQERKRLFMQMRQARMRGNNAWYYTIKDQLDKMPPPLVCWLDEDRFCTGHLGIVTGVIGKQSLQYSVEDKRTKPTPYLNLRWNVEPPEMRYYQKDALDKAELNERGVFESCVGSGKSLCIINLIKQKEVNTLIVVPSKPLVRQLYKSIALAFGPNKVEVVTSASANKSSSFKPIRICNIQSLAALQKKGDIQKIVSDVDQLIVDEVHHCLSGKEKIITDQGLLTIRQIVDREIKCKVLSQSKDGTLEFKPVVNRFKYSAPLELIEIEFEHNGRTKTIRCTENHKIYTNNRGYVEAGNLTTEDDFVVQKESVCSKCNLLFSSISEMTGHMTSHFMALEKYKELARKMVKHPNHNSLAARKLNSESKKGSKNPAKRSEVRAKMSKNIKAYFHALPVEKQLEQIVRFQHAPAHGVSSGPTSLEQRIVCLAWDLFVFTGNGQKWLSSNSKWLNPDFISVAGENKVIETGDTDFWHNRRETEARIGLYNKINWKCLYLKSEIMNILDDQELRYFIERFVYG